MQYVCLLRGINVGGHHKLPMAALRELLAGLGATDIATYIQSGNAVFSGRGAAKGWAKKISAAIGEAHGFVPQVLVMSAADYREIADAYPFSGAAEAPKNHHVFFLTDASKAFDDEKAETLAVPGEAFLVTDRAAYLCVNDGLSTSKLAAAFARMLGGPSTARNWRSVQKVADLLG